MKQKKGRSADSARKTGAPKRLPKPMDPPGNRSKQPQRSSATSKGSAVKRVKVVLESKPARVKPAAKTAKPAEQAATRAVKKAAVPSKPRRKTKMARLARKVPEEVRSSRKTTAREPGATPTPLPKATTATKVADIAEVLKPAAIGLERKPLTLKAPKAADPAKSKERTRTKQTRAKKTPEKSALSTKAVTSKPGRKARLLPKGSAATRVADITEVLKPAATGLEHKPALKPEPPESKRPVQRTSMEPARPSVPMPAILLEGDELGSPMTRLETQGASLAETSLESASLPSVGTGRMLLIAKDPKTLYVAWDLTEVQQRLANVKSRTGQMTLLIWKCALGKQLVAEIQVNPESRHWFAHVPASGEFYFAELGYYDADENWCTVATSTPARAPAERGPIIPQHHEFKVAEVRPVMPAAVPQGSEPPKLAETAPPVAQELQSVAEAASISMPEPRMRETLHVPGAPKPAPVLADETVQLAAETVPQPPGQPFQPAENPPSAWTADNARQIIELSGMAAEERVIGSVELLELISWISRQEGEVSSLEMAQPPAPQGELPSELIPLPGVSSQEHILPSEQAAKPRKFWFQVNAELVIYGATEPDARVTIGGRRIRLREDGSFSYRFALPDGAYQLPIIAESRDGDIRQAKLEFARQTSASGEVGIHPQDSSLKVPRPESIS